MACKLTCWVCLTDSFGGIQFDLMGFFSCQQWWYTNRFVGFLWLSTTMAANWLVGLFLLSVSMVCNLTCWVCSTVSIDSIQIDLLGFFGCKQRWTQTDLLGLFYCQYRWCRRVGFLWLLVSMVCNLTCWASLAVRNLAYRLTMQTDLLRLLSCHYIYMVSRQTLSCLLGWHNGWYADELNGGGWGLADSEDSIQTIWTASFLEEFKFEILFYYSKAGVSEYDTYSLVLVCCCRFF